MWSTVVKILIVEDEPKTGEYLRQGLGEAGFVVDLAQNGIDGLHLARQGTYDLVILDVMLPGMDGWQVLTFLETPASALDGQTPRAALEQGVPAKHILALATAEAH